MLATSLRTDDVSEDDVDDSGERHEDEGADESIAKLAPVLLTMIRLHRLGCKNKRNCGINDLAQTSGCKFAP